MNHWLSRCVAVAALAFVGCLGASAAFAGAGLNLGWGPFCPTSPSSAVDASDPCDGTSGATYQLIGSAAPSIALAKATAEEVSLDIQESSSTLGDYWRLEDENQPGQTNPAGCRGTNPGTTNVGSLSVSAGTSAFPSTFTGCTKFWGASPSGGVNYIPGANNAGSVVFGPNHARLDQKWSKNPSSAMNANQQYGSFSALFDTNHQLAVADPGGVYPAPFYSCAGCTDGVCIVYNQCIIRQEFPNPDLTISNQDVRQYVTWQAGAGQSANCTAVPVKRASWGQVKSLYR